MDIERKDAIKKSLSNAFTERSQRNANKKKKKGCDPNSGFGLNSSQGLSFWRFPEVVKRMIRAVLAQQRSCLAASSMQLASGPRI